MSEQLTFGGGAVIFDADSFRVDALRNTIRNSGVPDEQVDASLRDMMDQISASVQEWAGTQTGQEQLEALGESDLTITIQYTSDPFKQTPIGYDKTLNSITINPVMLGEMIALSKVEAEMGIGVEHHLSTLIAHEVSHYLNDMSGEFVIQNSLDNFRQFGDKLSTIAEEERTINEAENRVREELGLPLRPVAYGMGASEQLGRTMEVLGRVEQGYDTIESGELQREFLENNKEALCAEKTWLDDKAVQAHVISEDAVHQDRSGQTVIDPSYHEGRFNEDMLKEIAGVREAMLTFAAEHNVSLAGTECVSNDPPSTTPAQTGPAEALTR